MFKNKCGKTINDKFSKVMIFFFIKTFILGIIMQLDISATPQVTTIVIT